MPWVPDPFTGGVVWKDLPDTSSALDAANLNQEENAEAAYAVHLSQSVVNYFEGGNSASVPAVSGATSQDLIVRQSGSWVRFAVGVTDQVLKVRSDGTMAWVTLPAISAAAWGAGRSKTSAQNSAALSSAVGQAATNAGQGPGDPYSGSLVELPAGPLMINQAILMKFGVRCTGLNGAGGTTLRADPAGSFTNGSRSAFPAMMKWDGGDEWAHGVQVTNILFDTNNVPGLSATWFEAPGEKFLFDNLTCSNTVAVSRVVNDAQLTAGSNVVTLTTSTVTEDDVNAIVGFPNAGAAPTSAPTLTASGTGSSFPGAQQFTVGYTYVTASGETALSATATITPAAGQNIVITSPPVRAGATGWLAYVSQAAGGGVVWRQQAAGAATAIGTPLTLTAPPVKNTASPYSRIDRPSWPSQTSLAATATGFVMNNPAAATCANCQMSILRPTDAFVFDMTNGGAATGRIGTLNGVNNSGCLLRFINFTSGTWYIEVLSGDDNVGGVFRISRGSTSFDPAHVNIASIKAESDYYNATTWMHAHDPVVLLDRCGPVAVNIGGGTFVGSGYNRDVVRLDYCWSGSDGNGPSLELSGADGQNWYNPAFLNTIHDTFTGEAIPVSPYGATPAYPKILWNRRILTGGGSPLLPQLASKYLTPSGGDDSAAMADALTNYVPFVRPMVVMGQGTFLWNTRVPGFLPSASGSAGSVTGAGEGKTVIKLSSGAPRSFDFGKVADHDTFPRITLKGFTVDNNGLASSDHVVIGTLQAGTFQTRINVTGLTVEHVNTINVPVSVTGAYQRRSVSIVVRHLADNEATQNVLKDILITDCDFAGGAYGAQVGGTSPGNSANVFYDRVWFVRAHHDTGVVPTAAMLGNGANFFIGSAAKGGTCGIIDCYGANSCDVGIEIDNATSGYISPNTEIVDAWNVNFFTRNFRAPADLDAQTVEINGIARNVNIDPTTGGPSVQHFAVGGDAATAAYVFGHVIFGNIRSVFETPLANTSLSGLCVGITGKQVRRVTLKTLTVAAPNLAVNPTANAFPAFVDLRSTYATATVRVESVHFKLDGARSGVNSIGWKMVRIAGPARFEVQSITHDIAGISGIGANDTFYWLILDDGLGSTLDGSIRGIKALTAPVGGTHYGAFITGTGTLTIPGVITIDGCDLANLPAAAGLDYNINATQAAKVRINGWLTARGAGHGPLQAATAITVPASGVAYTNTDNINELVTVSGGTVSSLVLGQGGNVTVANAGTYLLRPGDTLTPTYTVPPTTMIKSPAV